MTRFAIAPRDAGQRLDKFLRGAAPRLPAALLYKALRTKHVKRNGARAQGGDRLQAGDVVECWLADEFFAPLEAPAWQYDFLGAGKELTVLYEDAHALLLDKPAGLLSHPDQDEYVDTLLGRVQRYLYEKGEYAPSQEGAFAPALANRIDRNTQGIVIAAKTAEALRVLNEKMKRRELRKFYLCAVRGAPSAGEPLRDGWRLLRGWLSKDEGKSLARVYDAPRPGAKEILTRYRIACPLSPDSSLLEVELLTGRTHQIRAQLAAVGHALVGDGKYAPRAQYQGDRASGQKRQCLCAYRLAFAFQSPAGALESLNGLVISVRDVAFLRESFPAVWREWKTAQENF